MFDIKNKVLFINLDSARDRKNYIEKEFSQFNISPIRISAIPHNEINNFLYGEKPDGVTDKEIACTMSHLKAIKYFIEETNDDNIFICEDDLSLNTVQHWNFKWSDIYNNLPYDYDAFQFTVINPLRIIIPMHRSEMNDFSAGAYLITRHHAQKLYNLHIINNMYKLDNNFLDFALSERILFYSGKSYCMPIFYCSYEFDSQIQELTKQAVNTDSAKVVSEFWEEYSKKIEIKDLMRIDKNRLP